MDIVSDSIIYIKRALHTRCQVVFFFYKSKAVWSSDVMVIGQNTTLPVYWYTYLKLTQPCSAINPTFMKFIIKKVIEQGHDIEPEKTKNCPQLRHQGCVVTAGKPTEGTEPWARSMPTLWLSGRGAEHTLQWDLQKRDCSHVATLPHYRTILF